MSCGKKSCDIKKPVTKTTNSNKKATTITKNNDDKAMINITDELKELKVGETKVFNEIDNKTEHGFEKGFQKLTRTKNGYVYSYSYEAEENTEEKEKEEE
ncbi:hypothetical protein IKS57_05525 [bacterium]|nr:hypothetical protein [bacterium]